MEYKIYRNKTSFIDDGNEIAGVTFPERSPGVYDINHTWVDESQQGKGLAGRLVQMAIGEINSRGGEITASCSYAQHFIEKNGIRPYVICHMVTSIDGKVTGDFLSSEIGLKAAEEYYEINRKLKGDAFACGRVTMESSFTGGFKPDLSKYEGTKLACEDYVAMKHSYYAVSFDRHGSVGWTDSKIHDDDPGYDDCHIIEVLSKDVSDAYLAYLQSIGVSYIFAGENDIDIRTALNKLYSLFGIKKLMLEGGSIINGAFERADVIDELSLVTAAVIADKDDKPLFYNSIGADWKLFYSESLNNAAMWSRYRK